MTACTRNCWISAALAGLVVWAFTAAGGVGAIAGLFLGLVTAWLLGGLLILLFCEGRGGEADDEFSVTAGGAAGQATAVPSPLPDAPRIAEAERPAGMDGAPEGAGAAGAAVTFAALGDGATPPEAAASDAPRDAIRTGAPQGAAADARQAVTFTTTDGWDRGPAGAASRSGLAGASGDAPEPPIEDTRAAMEDPSASADHDRPGEAVPAAEAPSAGKPGRDEKLKDKGKKKDKKSRDKPAKGKAEKAAKGKAEKDGSAKAVSRKDGSERKTKAGDGSAPMPASRVAASPVPSAPMPDAPMPAVAPSAAPVSADASRAVRRRDAETGDDPAAPPPAMTLTTPAAGASDDIGRIDGIGPKLTEWLHDNGITRFAQIAAWTPEDVKSWSARLGRWGGRIESDDWVGQARILAAGGETAHSRRVGRGEST